MNAKFNCEKCGACCRFVGCPLITEDNLCPIYENRPDICRVKDNFELTKMFCRYLRQEVKKWTQ